MSRRRASSAGAVSLFPFLAVLVCAMGALILLLLVTTRRIRQQTIAEKVIVQPLEEPEAEVPQSESVPSPPAVAETSEPDPVDRPLLPLLAEDPPDEPEDPTPALLEELAVLEAEQAALAEAITRRQKQLSALDAATSEQTKALRQQVDDKAEQSAEKVRLNNLYTRLRRQQEETEQRAEELRQQIRHTRAQLAEADSKFAVIPYDGHSGTTRRPIIIECTADRLTFVSEGISLQASDLEGFNERYNPLLYVTQALYRYWQRRERTDEEVDKPYVMLVVRPGGTTTYYVARKLLDRMGEQFGYELVTDDQQFTWPESEPEAIAICHTLIDKMLAERDEKQEAALRLGATLPEYSDEQGHFFLPEIERLKNPRRQLTFNGQTFDRNRYSGSGLSRPPGQGDRSPEPGFDRHSSAGGPGQADDQSPFSNSTGEASRGADGGDDHPQSVYTRQNSAVTQEDRATEWLREGTTRIAPPSRDSDSTRTSEIDPFADLPQAGDAATAQSAGRPQTSGRSREGSGTGSGTTTSTDRQPAPSRLDFTPDAGADAADIDDSQPEWGPRSGNGLIGFEKQIRITVTATQVTLGKDNAFQFDRSVPTGDLQRLLVGAINREVRDWGPPPKSFYWIPAIHFAVTPDARPQYERLKGIVKDWDVYFTYEPMEDTESK